MKKVIYKGITKSYIQTNSYPKITTEAPVKKDKIYKKDKFLMEAF